MENLENNMNGWNEYAKYVLITIEKLSKDIERLEAQTVSNKEELIERLAKDRSELISIVNELSKSLIETSTAMKVRNSILGAIGGLIAGGIMSLLLTLILG